MSRFHKSEFDLLPEFAFRTDGHKIMTYEGGKGSAPPPPDYAGAAKAQGVANVEAARASAKLSNPNIINPYGVQTVEFGRGGTFDQAGYDRAIADYEKQLAAYNGSGGNLTPKYTSVIDAAKSILGQSDAAPQKVQGPAPIAPKRESFIYGSDPDSVTIRQSLTPEGKALFDQQNRISSGLGNLAEGGIDRVGAMLGSKFDMSQVRARPDLDSALSRDQVTRSIVDRNSPMMDRRRQQLETQLSNQGIFRGSEAYKSAQDDLARQENDFNLGAIQAGGQEQSRLYGLESDARQQDIQTQAYLRSLPLNEINALRSGAQVNMPQFQAYQGQNIAPAPIFAGTQAQEQADLARFNAKQAGNSAFTSGLFSLGSSALLSDARAKQNISRVGYTDGGLPVYVYNYIGSTVRHMGVMAQDVEKVNPDAVIEHESGYKMVDYSKVK